MKNVVPFKRPIRWHDLRMDEAEKIINDISKISDNVIIIGHPEERADERNFLDSDIFRILQTGTVTKVPEKIKNGKWEVIIEKRMSGGRDAGVVTIVIENNKKIIVKTIEWMD